MILLLQYQPVEDVDQEGQEESQQTHTQPMGTVGSLFVSNTWRIKSLKFATVFNKRLYIKGNGFFFFSVVLKLILRIVEIHWRWYRLLNYWYRDNPNSNYPIMFLCSHLHNWCSHLHLHALPGVSPLPPLSFSHLKIGDFSIWHYHDLQITCELVERFAIEVSSK